MGTSREGVLQLTRPSYPDDIIFAGDGEPVQSIYEESATQEYRLGTKLVYPDGRIFRYAEAGETLSKALMTSAQENYAYCDAETQSTYGTSANVGDIEIDIDVTTGGSWPENDFAGGYIVNTSGTATCIGDIYRVVANKIDGSDDTKMRVQLETPIRVAWDASSVIYMMKNAYKDVEKFPTTPVGTATGIPLIDVTSGYFFWAQRGGYAPCIVDDGETLVMGDAVGHPATVADEGACGVVGATDHVWGYVVMVAGTDAAALIDLTIDT
jgi:hypothetical protein